MKSGVNDLARADTAVWRTIGVIAIAVAGFALMGHLELNTSSFLLPAAATALLAAGGWFYRSIGDRRARAWNSRTTDPAEHVH